jgi:HAD superfamily hydrolase (TIGR01549 family)
MHLDEAILSGVEIYGFAGKLGSGKNYLAEKVFSKMLEPKSTVFLCFADQIKIDGIYKKGLDRNKCWIKKDEHTRRTLQTVGTEEGRDVFGKDIWTNNTKEWMIMHAFRGIKRIIITDMRFKNEFDFIKNLGGTNINVISPRRNKQALERESSGDPEKLKVMAEHSSEVDLDSGREFDFVIFNDFGQELSALTECRNIIRDVIEHKREDRVIFTDLDNTICKCNEYYTIQANKVKQIIKNNLEDEMSDKVLDTMFSSYVNKHNGSHFTTHFSLDSFSKSLVMVLEDFREFMVKMSDEQFDEIYLETAEIGMAVYDAEYAEIPGRIKELEELSGYGKVVIYTMGDRLEQVKKIATLGLMDYDFEIYDFKDETIYRNLKHRYPAHEYIMIGDSYSRDIAPAVNVGMEGFHITGHEEGYWYLGAKEGDSKAHRVTSIKEVTKHLKRKDSKEPAVFISPGVGRRVHD